MRTIRSESLALQRVTSVGDEAEFRDSVVLEEDEFTDVEEVELAQGRGVLTTSKDGLGPVRIDADVNGELVTIMLDRIAEDGVSAATKQQFVELADSYIASLYDAEQ